MPAKVAGKKPVRKQPVKSAASASIDDQVKMVIAALEGKSSKATLAGMARYNIPSTHAFGVSMKDIQAIAKRMGKSHDLADALWATGKYEARMMCSFIDEPDRVSSAQMDRWCRDFDNWGICDTVCFVLFDRTPHAWEKVAKWGDRREEFVKRAAFALLWGLTVHDKQSGDAPFLASLPLVERAATDDRHLVKKAVNMALRAIGKRSRALNAAAVASARRLAASDHAAAQWVGKDALRELTSAGVTRRLAARR